LAIAAKAQAFLNKRGYVVPEDVKAICVDVLRHRIGLTYEAEAESISAIDVIERILEKVNTP
jgi:MoxR-like ATPase